MPIFISAAPKKPILNRVKIEARDFNNFPSKNIIKRGSVYANKKWATRRLLIRYLLENKLNLDVPELLRMV